MQTVSPLPAGGRHLEEDHRRAPGQADDLELQPGDRLRSTRPPRRHDAVDQAVLLPVLVEHRALRRDRDVVGERGDDLLVPGAGREGGDGLGLVGLQRQVRVACVHDGRGAPVGVGSIVRDGAGRLSAFGEPGAERGEDLVPSRVR